MHSNVSMVRAYKRNVQSLPIKLNQRSPLNLTLIITKAEAGQRVQARPSRQIGRFHTRTWAYNHRGGIRVEGEKWRVIRVFHRELLKPVETWYPTSLIFSCFLSFFLTLTLPHTCFFLQIEFLCIHPLILQGFESCRCCNVIDLYVLIIDGIL